MLIIKKSGHWIIHFSVPLAQLILRDWPTSKSLFFLPKYASTTISGPFRLKWAKFSTLFFDFFHLEQNLKLFLLWRRGFREISLNFGKIFDFVKIFCEGFQFYLFYPYRIWDFSYRIWDFPRFLWIFGQICFTIIFLLLFDKIWQFLRNFLFRLFLHKFNTFLTTFWFFQNFNFFDIFQFFGGFPYG